MGKAEILNYHQNFYPFTAPFLRRTTAISNLHVRVAVLPAKTQARGENRFLEEKKKIIIIKKHNYNTA